VLAATYARRTVVKRILLAIVLLASASEAAAQACLALPTRPGQVALSGAVETEGSTLAGYRASVVANTPIGMIAGGSYRYDELPEIGHTFGGLVGIELPLPTSSICPLLEVSYSIPDRGETGGSATSRELRTLRIPLTLGVGQRLDIFEVAYVVPAARAGIIHVRNRLGDGPTAETTTSNNVQIGAGVTLGRGVAFLNGGATVTTEADGEPRFHFGFGIMLP